MKHIVKSNEPQILLNFKEEFKSKRKKDAVFEDIPTNIKQDLKVSLSEQQYYLCCYCMKRIKPHNSHIEHIKPQSKFKNETLDYMNLLVSCNGIQDSNEHCGHNKEGWYDKNDFVSPVVKDCENIFSYNIAGQIDAVQKNGKITINKLNLNSLLLVRARKALIGLAGLFNEDFDQRRQEILDYNSIPNANNELPPFCMAVIYCINNYL